MGKDSAISWTDHTFNPWWGCDKVSPGCKFCYADAFAARTGQKVWGAHAPRRFFGLKHWTEPLRWHAAAEKAQRRTRVFCASMCDLFERHADPETDLMMRGERAKVFSYIGNTPWLDWQLLTKRPENVAAMVPEDWMAYGFPRSVWLGCTVEDNERAAERLPYLFALRATVSTLWVSYEPALDLVPFGSMGYSSLRPTGCDGPGTYDALAGSWWPALGDPAAEYAGRHEELPHLDWIVVGGESGGKRRPFDPAWASATVAACAAAGVACWVKQDGALKPGQQGRLSDEVFAVKQHPSVDVRHAA